MVCLCRVIRRPHINSSARFGSSRSICDFAIFVRSLDLVADSVWVWQSVPTKAWRFEYNISFVGVSLLLDCRLGVVSIIMWSFPTAFCTSSLCTFVDRSGFYLVLMSFNMIAFLLQFTFISLVFVGTLCGVYSMQSGWRKERRVFEYSTSGKGLSPSSRAISGSERRSEKERPFSVTLKSLSFSRHILKIIALCYRLPANFNFLAYWPSTGCDYFEGWKLQRFKMNAEFDLMFTCTFALAMTAVSIVEKNE